MKNLKKYIHGFLLILIVFPTIFLFGCSKKSDIVESSVEALTLCELEQVEGVENLSDDTIKALSVIIRTNIKNSDYQNFAYVPNNKRLSKLVKETNGETLDSISTSSINLNNQTYKKIGYIKDNETWKVEIKISQILKYLKNNNINLSNISNINPIYSDENCLTGIEIGGKFISYEVLEKEFGLKSNKIIKIENTLTKIVVTGEYEKAFNINSSEDLANSGKNYNQILNHFFS